MCKTGFITPKSGSDGAKSLGGAANVAEMREKYGMKRDITS
jgi:hypothetical protein